MVYTEEEANPMLVSSGPRRRAPVPQVSDAVLLYVPYIMIEGEKTSRAAVDTLYLAVSIFSLSPLGCA